MKIALGTIVLALAVVSSSSGASPTLAQRVRTLEQQRHRSVLQHPIGHAPQQQSCQPLPAMRGESDEVNGAFLRLVTMLAQAVADCRGAYFTTIRTSTRKSFRR